MTTVSDLGPSGFTRTNDQLHAFAGQVVAKAKDTFQQRPMHCNLWGYRYSEHEMLSCDLFSDDKSLWLPITITACQTQDLTDLREPYVHDMVEALHLAKSA